MVFEPKSTPLVQSPNATQNPMFKPVPVDISGLDLSGSVPAFSEITGTVAGLTGSNLQAILVDIATRIAALETPTP